MKFENEFDVAAPIDEVYDALLDVERVAPNVPGASVLEQTGENTYKVAIKVKVGPMSMVYRGEVEIVDKDAAAHKATLKVKMKESRGQGNATANVAMGLGEADGRTTARMDTDVELSGKVAAMGRGVIQDVSGKLVKQFAGNLQEMLEGKPEPEPEPAPAEPAPAAASELSAGPAATSSSDDQPPAPKPAPAPQPSDDALDLGELGGQVLLSQLKDPRKAGALLAVLALIALLIGRSRR